ncbi:hypothetical protein ACFQQL_01805, partial [Georgenia alba]
MRKYPGSLVRDRSASRRSAARRGLAAIVVAVLAMIGLAAPTMAATDPPADPTVTIEPNQLAPGDPFVLSGEGYTPDSTIQGQTLAEDGTVLNEFTADADQNGAFSQDLEVPADLEPGTYGVRMTDTTGATAETTATVIDTTVDPT